MNTRFKRRNPEGTVPAREGTVPTQKANTSTRIKRRITVEIDPEEWRGRGQPRALGLDDIVVDLEGHKGSRIIKRREALRMLGGKRLRHSSRCIARRFTTSSGTVPRRSRSTKRQALGQRLATTAQCPARGDQCSNVDLSEQEPARHAR